MQNNVTQSNIIYGIVGLFLGVLLASFSVNTNNQGMMRMMGLGKASQMMNSTSGMMGSQSGAIEDMSMGQMEQSLADKSGDDFDKEFIANMIAHHEGAVNMAKKANESAKRSEIKELSQEVTSAQTKEIEMMRGWYKDWYGKEVEDEHELHHQ